MPDIVILAALVGVPILLIMVLRVNATIAFMSLCLGSVLVTYTTSDATDLINSFAAKGTMNATQWVQIGLLTVPFLLAILFTRKSVHGSQQVTNFLPAAASGLLYALLATPLLNANLQKTIHASSLWRQLSDLQTAVVLGGAVFSLLFILVSYRSHREGHTGKRGKH